jgi:TonB family protein
VHSIPRAAVPLLPVALVVLASAACVSTAGRTSSPDGTAAYHRLSEVDQRPSFIGCSAYEPPHSGNRNVGRVLVRYDISASGQVVNVMVVREPQLPGTRGLGARAAQVASSCRYSPAIRNGEPVAVRSMQRYFSFEIGG